MFPGRMVKEKVEKEGNVSLFHQCAMLLAWPLSFSSSCVSSLVVAGRRGYRQGKIGVQSRMLLPKFRIRGICVFSIDYCCRSFGHT
ncbi:hypothetical protein V6N12_058560 [Hibiscus sabdariffa]|uniref:Uncharacterized protein n=1 Tax=Hibiscus sabdariffa TaxID=183260 RepID=A0ABR2ESI3_9ROSI